MGFYDTLRSAGPVMILAPILGAVGLTLVTVSHLIPIAMGYELVGRCHDGSDGLACSSGHSPDGWACSARLLSDRQYLQHRLHWLLRFHADHGHRSAPKPLQSRRTNPSINTNTQLTKGRIDPRRGSKATGAGGQGGSSTMSGGSVAAKLARRRGLAGSSPARIERSIAGFLGFCQRVEERRMTASPLV